MSVMFNVIFISRCSSTHHKLAMDALRHVRGDDAERWRRLFLKHHPSYLEGSKAPDTRFKDFKNHVLHVAEGEWGGAIKAVQTWYDRFVHALRQRDWEEAVFSAGVLSHYYTDPIQPFHTGQSEAEGKVHRAAEWSIAKSYHELQNILEQDLDGYPAVELPTTADWLADHVRNGARTAHQYYETCIEHYDLAKGVRNPPAGLDQELKDILAELIGLAAVGFARLLERGFDESQVQPPEVELVLDTIIAQARRPVNWVVRQVKDQYERNLVMDIYREVQNTGKAVETLPNDDRMIRRLHAQEVRRIPLGELDAEPAKAAGTAHGTGEPPRMRSREAITRMARGSRFRFSRTPRTAKAAGETVPASSVERTSIGGVAPVTQSAGVSKGAVYQAAPRPAGVSVAGQRLVSELVDGDRDREVRSATLARTAGQASSGTPNTWGAGTITAEVGTLGMTAIVSEGSSAGVPVSEQRARNRQSSGDSLPVLLDREGSRETLARLRESVDRRASDDREPRSTSSGTPMRSVVDQVSEDRPAAEWEASRQRDFDRLRQEREQAERARFDAEQRDRQERQRAERERAERERAEREQRERADRLRLAESEESPVRMPSSRPTRFYLEPTSDIEAAPSIGGKTADRLRSVGLRTVRHLLEAQPEKTAARINQRWITAEVIRQWQQQASLVCRIPDLRGHDAQILVGCGITDPNDLARRNPEQLKSAVDEFCATTAGERVLRGSAGPDDAEIREWIDAAGRARALHAA